jgi:hypothetical protein
MALTEYTHIKNFQGSGLKASAHVNQLSLWLFCEGTAHGYLIFAQILAQSSLYEGKRAYGFGKLRLRFEERLLRFIFLNKVKPC